MTIFSVLKPYTSSASVISSPMYSYTERSLSTAFLTGIANVKFTNFISGYHDGVSVDNVLAPAQMARL